MKHFSKDLKKYPTEIIHYGKKKVNDNINPFSTGQKPHYLRDRKLEILPNTT